MTDSTDGIEASDLDETAERVRASLRRAASETFDDRPMPALTAAVQRKSGRVRYVAIAAALALIVGAAALVISDRDDNDDRVTAGESKIDQSLGRPLPDLGFPEDLIDDAGAVRALVGSSFAADAEPGLPESGGIAFDRTVDPPRLVVAVGDIEAARPEIEAAVSDPSRVDIVEATLSRDQQIARIDEVGALVGDAGNVGLAQDMRAVNVELAAGEEALGAQLIEQFGVDVQVQVGFHKFPYSTSQRCPTLPAFNDSIETDVEVLTPQVTFDSDGSAIVTVTNISDSTVEVKEPQAGPGVWPAYVVLAGTDTVVSSTFPAGVIIGTAEGRGPTPLGPGEELQVAAGIERPACRVSPHTGTMLQAGRCDLVAVIERVDGEPARTQAVPIEVVDELPG